jgi:hypothetical protein
VKYLLQKNRVLPISERFLMIEGHSAEPGQRDSHRAEKVFPLSVQAETVSHDFH